MKSRLLIVTMFIAVTVFAQEEASGSFFNYNGANIYYEEHGEGEPLLLLHTFYGTTRQWKDYILPYSEKFRVIAVDMFGHGRSDIFSTSKEFRHGEYARAILALMDHLEIEQANAIGASSGAITLLHANYLHPDRFKAVVQIGGQVYFGEETRRWIREERADSANAVFMNRYNTLHGPEKARLLTRQFWNLQFMTGESSFTPDMLRTFTATWLVVQGDNDFVGLYHALEMDQHIPKSYLWIVPNGGHFPHLIKENIPDFTRRTIDFFTGVWDSGR